MARQRRPSLGRERSVHEHLNRPPAYFLSLTLKNVRCFGPEQTLDLSDGENRPARWTLILGENGVGKTTILQCLVAMEPEKVEVGDNVLRHLIKANINSPAMPRIIAIPSSPRGWDSRFDFYRFADLPGRLEVNLAYGSKLDDFGLYHVENTWASFAAKRPNTITNRGGSFYAYERIGELICYPYGTHRGIRSSYIVNQDNDDSTASIFSNDAPLRDPESWWLQTDYNVHLSQYNPHFQHYAQNVKKVLVDLLPDVSDLRIVPPHEVKDRPRVEVLTPYGWVPLRRLGSGYQGHIAWVVDLASRLFERYPDSANPLAEPAVVLIDEIDLHMHPRWQREIIGYLTERLPNTQFIVTAHSPLIVQAAEDANLVLLRREGDHVVIDNDPVRLRNWRVDQILTSDLFGLESARPPQIEGLLKERRELLSKGRLTTRDRRRIQALEAEIGDLPAGETVEDSRAMEIIRRAAAKLQGEGGA